MPRVCRAALLALVGVVPLAAAAVDQPVAKPKAPFGIVAFDLNDPVPTLLGQLGIGLVRGSCNWSDLEPAKEVFDWTCSDNVIVGAEQLRLRSYMTVVCTPAWANDGAGCGAMPVDITDWYTFVTNFVSRYSKYHTALGVWNEPNLTLADTPSGRNYALLFVNASNARNTVNNSFPIAGPETSDHALASGYFRETMDLIDGYGGFDAQDIVSVHWYPGGPDLLGYLDDVHAAAGSHEVWLSETGQASVDPQAQAGFYDRMLRLFTTSRRAWWTHIVFYRLWDGADCCSDAIVDSAFRPKPAFDIYQSWMLKSLAVPRFPPKPSP